MATALTVLAVLLALFLLTLTPPGRSLRSRLMARMYDRSQARHEAHVADRKRELLCDLAGTVLELGPGTGVNFRYLPATVTRWIGVEPNPHMHAALREASAGHAAELEIRGVTAAGMTVEDGSVDAVLSTLVLCSVPDPDRVVHDIVRVLRPGGKFVFLEHVGAARGTRLRRLQRLLRPVWKYFADGCCPDRETAAVIQRGGFADVHIDEFRIPKKVAPAVIAPHIAGVAVKGGRAP